VRTTILFLLLPALACPGDETPAPSLAAATGELEVALGARLPAEATTAIGRIQAAYPKGAEGEQKAAVAALGKAAGDKDLRVRHAAIAALGALKAKGSSRHLVRWLNPPKQLKEEMPTTYVEALRACGEIADPATLDDVLELSDHPSLEIAVAATEAVGGFGALPVGRRKALAFDMVDRLRMLTTPSRRADYGPEAEARRSGLSAAILSALRRLTGLKYESPNGWIDWKERSKNKANPFE